MGNTVVRDIVCVGASTGGVAALIDLVGQLSPDLPAAIFIVLHTAPGSPGALASVLARRTSIPTEMASHGEAIAPGRIRIAPPDFHLALEGDRVVLDRSPPENRVRPAIDALFRSAAVVHGARVIGVVLTGHLSDGSTGAVAIRRCGGAVVAQTPEDAEAPSMPRSTIDAAAPDRVVPLARMGETIRELVGRRVPTREVPRDLVLEAPSGLRMGEEAPDENDRIGQQAPFVCPDCGGPLWKLSTDGPPRFRCLLGHALNADVLTVAKGHASLHALLVAARTLDERARLLTDMARSHRSMDRGLSADRYDERSAQVRAAADQIRRILMAAPPVDEDGL